MVFCVMAACTASRETRESGPTGTHTHLMLKRAPALMKAGWAVMGRIISGSVMRGFSVRARSRYVFTARRMLSAVPVCVLYVCVYEREREREKHNEIPLTMPACVYVCIVCIHPSIYSYQQTYLTSTSPPPPHPHAASRPSWQSPHSHTSESQESVSDLWGYSHSHTQRP